MAHLLPSRWRRLSWCFRPMACSPTRCVHGAWELLAVTGQRPLSLGCNTRQGSKHFAFALFNILAHDYGCTARFCRLGTQVLELEKELEEARAENKTLGHVSGFRSLSIGMVCWLG